MAHPEQSTSANTNAASWEVLNNRPNPAWFDQDKIGIFLHWGLFSVPAFAGDSPEGKPYGYGGHCCWYGSHISRMYPLADDQQKNLEAFHRRTFGGDFSYDDIAHLFRAELFDASHWAQLFKRAGAKWAIVTSNFHDGFCLWPSPYHPHWNSTVLGSRRDLLGEFTDAVRAEGLRAGFYYSLLEHNHPLFPKPDGKKPYGDLQTYVRNHMQPQLREAVRRYKPSFIYLDGEWDYHSDDFEMREFVDWLYHKSPCKDDVLINDRFGKESRGKHGSVYCSEIGCEQGGVQHKWIEDRPLARGDWSRNRNQRLDFYLAERDMLHILVGTISRGGNIHFDLSPYADGTIPLIEQERMHQLGDWLAVNGEGIYGTTQWTTVNEGAKVATHNPYLRHDGVDAVTGLDNWIWTAHRETPMVHYTKKGNDVYAFILQWPRGPLHLKAPQATANTKATLLGRGAVSVKPEPSGGVVIDLPILHPDDYPCRHIWTVKLSGLANA
jgi:alpha-L-fucosidase